MSSRMILTMCFASVLVAAAAAPALFSQTPKGQTPVVFPTIHGGIPMSGSWRGFPDADPDSGKFLGAAGINLQTLAGQKNALYLGIPKGRSSFTLGIFDGDGGSHWDQPFDPVDRLDFKLYKDALKSGSMTLLDSWDDTTMLDDDWASKAYSTDSAAKAPSGNYFYRLEVNWHDPSTADEINSFKVRVDGQISVLKNQPFCIEGGPIDVDLDPPLGSGDPNPGDTNDPGANSYDGDWLFYSYVPAKTHTFAMKDGDLDRADDDDDANTPNIDPDGPGPAIAEGVNVGRPLDDNVNDTRFMVSPNIYYVVTSPSGTSYPNNNPSGNQEWENFIISDSSALNPDHLTTNPQPPGLWKIRVVGMDAHNLACFAVPNEMFTVDETPLPVNPSPIVEPDRSVTVNVPPASTQSFAHNVTNLGATQVFDLSAESSHGWTTRIYNDSNGNMKLDPGELQVNDTGSLARNSTYKIIVQVDVPVSSFDLVDLTTVLASSQLEWAVQGSATDTINVIANRPPGAEAGGPYVSSENSPTTFDGSGSSDPDGDPLMFRWDFENDGIWDTGWSSSPIATRTWGDDYKGTVVLQVTDGNSTDMDTASLTINNVLPSGSVTITTAQHEGSSIQFSARFTDPGSDDLFFTWSWGDGTPDSTSTYYNNGVSPDPYPSTDIHPRDITDVKSHTYGDNGAFTVKVTVRDDDSGGAGTTVTIAATPDNLPPSVKVNGGMTIDEGQSVNLAAAASDPGSDDLKFAWSWGDGSSESRTYYNNGIGPDPPNSPGGTYPFSASDTATHPYGDNGIYSVALVVSDDDGGSTSWAGQVTVNNLLPSVSVSGNMTIDEGQSISLTAIAKDPGSDDLKFVWSWGDGSSDSRTYYNNGISPDPPSSPGGTYPFTANDAAAHPYGDNGIYSATLIVTDDDGGSISWAGQVTVKNLPPSFRPFGPFSVDEASPVSIDAIATDPGSDDLTFTWTYQMGPTIQHTVFNDGVGPDPPNSPGGTYPFSVPDSSTHVYGDDGVFEVTLVVEDDDGGVASYVTTVTVMNVAPSILAARAYLVADVTIRVAGEKWHDVILRLFQGGEEVGYAQVIRYPGSPDDQMATIYGVEMDMSKSFSAIAYYTPEDDPPNGQPNGADPAWLIITWESGVQTWLHHTFNVLHPETYVWMVDNVYLYAMGQDVHFEGTASDPGSDDLTFIWDLGDGSAPFTIYYNDGIGPDPYPSPDGTFPFTATDSQIHSYAMAGTYNIKLTVMDDDGGSTAYSFTVTIG